MVKIKSIICFIKPLLFVILFFSIITQPLFSFADYFIENNKYYNLKNYRSNQIFSKTYFRNLISYYFYDQKNRSDILHFLQKEQPEFYWLAKQLWDLENQFKKTYNPAIKIWLEYFRLESVKEYDYSEIIKNCDYFGDIFCNWLKDLDFIYKTYYKNNKQLNFEDYYIILKRLEIYLTKSYYIPFMYQTGKWLPEFLRKIGLNLESAIILKNMFYRQNEEIQKKLSQELIYSIFLSGDPDYAIKIFINSGESEIKYQNSTYNIFNIISLSKNFDLTINILKDETNINYWNLEGTIDIWTKFPITKYLIKIRLVDLIYWKNKNHNEAIVLLERLIANKDLNELEKQYARLIQSRILYNTNIELAQRIAEDVQFKAQEKGFYLLEYYATIWNGWCLYKLNKYYPANIEFTKAYNISNRHFPQISKYSVYLGLLLTKRKFQVTDINQIKNLENIFNDYIPDSYFFSTIEWVPEDIHYDIWKDIYIEYLNQNKKYDELKKYILQNYIENWFFEQSKNPGSYTGLYTSALYCKYIKCNYNYEIIFNNTTDINNIPKNNYILLYQTSKYYYAFINVNNINLLQFEKNSSGKSELIQKLKEYKNYTLYLNPHVDITHKELFSNSNNTLQFSLLYKNHNLITQLLTESLNQANDRNINVINNNNCKLNTVGEEIILSQKIKIKSDYPYLTKFFCNNGIYIRLWDLERFFPENKIVYFYDMGNEPELYQTLYYTAMQKNWLLIEIINNNILFIRN
ncbi:MAG: hypothetical protein KatS3mg129_0440 [Leptospiraceae bacterium]|nr:MAG: hypothetical protein KatS3mg129_0440 [Leptospiraceae bacterium]